MIFDFSYKTGADFSGMYSPLEQENIKSQYYGGLYLDSEIISGKNVTNLSLNGQMLAEQTPTKFTIGDSYVYLNSGDYFIKDEFTFNNVFFNENIPTNFLSRSNIFFAVKDYTGEIPLGSGVSASEMAASLSGSIFSKFPQRYGSYTGMDSFDYFLNGQKIYSGNNGSYSISGSTFVYNETITGKLFAIPKNSGIVNYTGLYSDIYNENFVESTVFGFVNGVSLDRINWIELYTGVNYIETGIQSRFFQSPLVSQQISL